MQIPAPPMAQKHIQILIGSTHPFRTGERVARWVVDSLATLPQVSLELLDIRDWLLPAAAPDRDPHIRAWAQKIAEGDGYVLIAPRFEPGRTRPLAEALTAPGEEWRGKPVLVVSYGRTAAMPGFAELRAMLADLGLRPAETGLHLTLPADLRLNQDWALLREGMFAPLAADLRRAVIARLPIRDIRWS